MAIRSLQMQLNMQQQLLNSSLYSLSFYNETNGGQFGDIDTSLQFDDTIDGAADNSSDLCPSFSYQNVSYLNVSCDTTLNYSIPLYGESFGTKLKGRQQ